jgi:hypothetical protein
MEDAMSKNSQQLIGLMILAAGAIGVAVGIRIGLFEGNKRGKRQFAKNLVDFELHRAAARERDRTSGAPVRQRG